MVLTVRWLHQITAEKIVDRWKPASLRMAPGIALYRGQTLCSEQSGDRVHAHFRIDQDMWSIGQDLLSPAVEWERALNKTIAKGSCPLRLGILLVSSVIAECSEPLTIQLAEPTLSRDSESGMAAEKPADDAHSHWLVRPRRLGQCCRRVAVGND